MLILTCLMGILFTAAALGLWLFFHTRGKTMLEAGAGSACVTGGCGDAVQLRLHFKDGRLAKGVQRTSGCAFSFAALDTAIGLARGKTAEDILTIDADLILQKVGDLPEDHRHAAVMAAEVLHQAVQNYMDRLPTENPAGKTSPKSLDNP